MPAGCILSQLTPENIVNHRPWTSQSKYRFRCLANPVTGATTDRSKSRIVSRKLTARGNGETRVISMYSLSLLRGTSWAMETLSIQGGRDKWRKKSRAWLTRWGHLCAEGGSWSEKGLVSSFMVVLVCVPFNQGGCWAQGDYWWSQSKQVKAWEGEGKSTIDSFFQKRGYANFAWRCFWEINICERNE